MKKQSLKQKTQPQTHVAKPAEKPFSWLKFAGKILFLFAVVVSVVIYTDKKEYFVGDQTNNHVDRKWRSFYRFVEKRDKDIDILFLGNSHISAGVEPYIVSMNTGTYGWILNSLGATVIQSYFNLREVLKYTKPKLVVLETHCTYVGELGGEWGRIQSFDAKKTDLDKFAIMPIIFESDVWVKAWSPTIRNHSFLLTDTERIKFNTQNKDKNPDRQPLDLGRFSHGSTHMTPDIKAKYDTLPAQIQVSTTQIGDLNKKYLKKLYDLCQENDIEMMFVSVPMYHNVFSDYDSLKTMQAEVFAEYCPKAKWLDLQQNYDTTLFTVQAFNNEYGNAQHATYYGMTICAYKLSDFIMQNYANILPDRSNEREWIVDFASQPHFLYLRDVPQGMQGALSIVKNRDVDNFHIREMFMTAGQDNNQLVLKIDKDPRLTQSITANLTIKQGDNAMQIPVYMQSFREITPPRHNVYVTELRKDITVMDVVNITSN